LLPSVLLILSGAWFVIGPWAWPTFESGAAFAAAPTATRSLLDVAAASLAPGLVLAVLGGMAWKSAMTAPAPVTEAQPAFAVYGGPDPAVGPVDRPTAMPAPVERPSSEEAQVERHAAAEETAAEDTPAEPRGEPAPGPEI
jgi:hypothetical protein